MARIRTYRSYGDDAVIPLIGDITRNASPNDNGYPDDPRAVDDDVAAQLDQLAVTGGSAVQRVVASAKPNVLGYALAAYVVWRILK